MKGRLINMHTPRLKILWSSNAIWSPSGYSNVSRDMYQNFRDNGWTPETLAFLDMYGLMGGKQKDDLGFLHYPIMDHNMGSDAMVHHGRDFKADVVISLQDVWPLNPQDLQQIPRYIPWAPIDYDPVPRMLTQNLRFANRIISMSRFGEKQLQENGLSSTFIPHGVNTKIFTNMDKRQRKIDLKINPDTFIFGMVSANKEAINPRKSFQQVLDAFKQFLVDKPNTLLYIHTDPEFPGGFNIKQYAEFLGIASHIAFPDRYGMRYNTPKEAMNLVYNTFDCLLSPSSSEGFGIPVIEAQACGVPAIVNDWTSMPEMIQEGVTGYKVKRNDNLKIFYPVGSYFCFPDTQDLYQKMLRVHDMHTDKMGVSARKWIMENYDQDMLFETKWKPFLTRIENEIYGQLTTPEK